MEGGRRAADQVSGTILNNAEYIDKRKGRQLRHWVLLGVFVNAVLLGLVFWQIREQNTKIHESVATAQDLSKRNAEILANQRATDERDAVQLAEEVERESARLRKLLRINRDEHNVLIRLIRGIIRRSGAGELLEDLPGPIGRGGGAGQPTSDTAPSGQRR